MLPHALVVAIRARCQNGVSIRLVIAKAKPNVAVISKPEVLVRRPIRIDSMKRDTERLNFSEQIPRPYTVSPAVMDLRKEVPPVGHASACPDRSTGGAGHHFIRGRMRRAPEVGHLCPTRPAGILPAD
jgi:hypothetical protein